MRAACLRKSATSAVPVKNHILSGWQAFACSTLWRDDWQRPSAGNPALSWADAFSYACTGLPEFFLTDHPSQMEVAVLTQWQQLDHSIMG